MRDDILFNSGKKSTYTEAEIEQAQKMKKKNGGTLMDNLAKLTGKSMPSMTSTAELSSMYSRANAELNSMIESDKKRKEIEAKNDAVKKQLVSGQMRQTSLLHQRRKIRHAQSLNEQGDHACAGKHGQQDAPPGEPARFVVILRRRRWELSEILRQLRRYLRTG